MNVRIITISELRRNVSPIIKALQQQGKAVYITRHGRPHAVLLSYEHYEQLLKQVGEGLPAAQVDPEIIRTDPEMIALVEEIKATPPNPAAIRPATGSLAEALKNAPKDPDFDPERWTQQWNAIEAEMKAIDRTDAIVEGRDWRTC
jgi:prevent-host-death family protein